MGDAVKVTVFDSFDDAQEVWEYFEQNGDCYSFQSYTWLKNWHSYVGSKLNITPCIASVEYPKGDPFMLLPLAIQKRRFARCLVWLGGQISDYQGPLLSRDSNDRISADVFAMVWAAVTKSIPHYDVVILEKQPAEIGSQGNPFLYQSCVPHPSNAHSACLTDSFDDFLKSKRSSKWRNTHRRKQRRLAEHGEVGFLVVKAQEEIDRVLMTTIRQKSRGYRELGVPDLFARNGHREFLEHLSSCHIKDSLVHLSALTLDDVIVATHWGLVYKERFYYLFPGYESGKYAAFSTGTILLEKLFEWCIQNGVRVFDFTDGDEPYKFLWSDQELKLYDYFAARTFKGWLYVWPLRLLRKLKLKIKQSEVLLRQVHKLRAMKAKLG